MQLNEFSLSEQELTNATPETRNLLVDSTIIIQIAYMYMYLHFHLSVAAEALCLIDMSSNEITKIHSIMNRKSSVQSVSFHKNAIKFINQQTFSQFPNLTALYLGQNNLEVVEYETFHTLHQMRFLHLYQNRIIRIECETFAEMPRLQELLLHGNKLKSLEENIIVPASGIHQTQLALRYLLV